jgi:hypothetical protein
MPLTFVTFLGVSCSGRGVEPLGMAPHATKKTMFEIVSNLTQLAGCDRFYCLSYQLFNC